jgi:hypothetical protein
MLPLAYNIRRLLPTNGFGGNFMQEEQDSRSAFVAAYIFMNFIGVLTGLFIGWVIWA